MSVFCTPDGRPFYAGTYFPPVERQGMPSFRRVVQALGDAWTKEREQVLEQADALVVAVQRELRLAEALSEEATGQGGRPLTRTIEAGPPLERGPGWVGLRRTQEDLARVLGVSDQAVRVQYRLTPPFAGAAMMRGPGGPPPGSRPWRERRFQKP